MNARLELLGNQAIRKIRASVGVYRAWTSPEPIYFK